MSDLTSKNALPEGWKALRKFTAARIGLSSSGSSISTKHTLAFQLDHAYARDAVYSGLNLEQLQKELEALNVESVVVQTQVTSREEYLQRPDRGRKLSQRSLTALTNIQHEADIVIVLGDGLSAEAINRHAIPVLRLLLDKLRKPDITIAPIIIAEHARVALADDIGSTLSATLSLIFIGERPGLSSPDSMGVYLTYDPKPGTTDESRNCISNIRPEGLKYEGATDKIYYLIEACFRMKFSGVAVKDKTGFLS